MRRLIGSAVLVTLVATFPTLAAAQRRAATMTEGGAEHELGVDLTFDYIHRGSVVTGGTSIGGGVQLFAPVDVRLGFLSKSQTMVEARASLNWDTKGAGAGGATLEFSPGVNVLYQLKRGTGQHGLLRATYVTGGAGLNFVHAGAAGSQTQFAINGGVGTRVPYGSAVLRPEGFMAYAFSSGFLPNAFSLGVRFGLSFWH